ncbi:MAG TPA: diguanylate cyclase [Pseudomonadales bacterium]|nr:diguanylate cyclase [Pseudomonadales bacterium]
MTESREDNDADVAEALSSLPAPLYRSPLKLQFTGQLELEFQRYFALRNIRNTRYLFTGSFCMFLLYGLMDRLLLVEPDPAWLIRYGIAGPLFIFFVFAAFTPLVRHAQQALITCAVISYSLVIMALIFLVPESLSQFYFSAFLIAMMAGLTLVGVQFYFALIATLIFVSVFFASSLFFQRSGAPVVVDFALLISAAIVCCFGTYFSERSARKEFIQNKIISLKQTQLEKVNEELKRLVDIDGLTGVANRRHFDEWLDREWRRAQRAHYPIALLMIDIDFFKKYNDSYGHQKGDACLKAVAAALQCFAQRPGDLIARYGGEEFALILPHLDLPSACQLGRQICEGIINEQIEHNASAANEYVSVSVGAASVVPHWDWSWRLLIEAADQALYLAKANGRNRCEGMVFGSEKLTQSMD